MLDKIYAHDRWYTEVDLGMPIHWQTSVRREASAVGCWVLYFCVAVLKLSFMTWMRYE